MTPLSRDPKCLPETLERLANDPTSTVYTEVAKHPACPPSVLRSLSQRPNCIVQLAGNPNTPPDVIEHIMQSGADRMVVALVEQADIQDSQQIEKHRADFDSVIARSIAHRPNCTQEQALWAVQHDHPQRLKFGQPAIESPQVPPYVVAMWQLAQDAR